MTDIGALGGGGASSTNSSYAYAINKSGTVAGASYGGAGGYDSFSYSGGTMTDLGPDAETALGINDSGTIVGIGGGTYAYVYTSADGVLNLNNLTVNLPIGWTLVEATAINDCGDIVGWGTPGPYLGFGNPGTDSGFETEAFLLTPTPEPGSLGLLAIGGIGLLLRGRRKKSQVL
jgi:probable HAF family extracellular repeat protein